MRIIIVGLGRMGTELAAQLSDKENEIVVIDKDPETFDKLNHKFSGQKVTGVGFDKAVLEQANITRADALIACTNSDETNVVIARIAKNIYRVPRVVARSYDMRKAEIYRRLGIRTISTTSWGVTRAVQLLTFDKFDVVYEIGSGGTNLLRVDVPPMLVGKEIRDITAPGEIHVTAITRGNKSFLPTLRTTLEHGDILYIAVINSAKDTLRSMLGVSKGGL